MKKYKINWSDTAKSDLNTIYNFIKKNSIQGAKNVISDIRESIQTILFSKQFQIEEHVPECRRIVVRNYKVIYQIDETKKEINIVRVFDVRQNPNKLQNL